MTPGFDVGGVVPGRLVGPASAWPRPVHASAGAWASAPASAEPHPCDDVPPWLDAASVGSASAGSASAGSASADALSVDDGRFQAWDDLDDDVAGVWSPADRRAVAEDPWYPGPVTDDDEARWEEAGGYGAEQGWGPIIEPPHRLDGRTAATGRRRAGRPQVLVWTCPKGGSGKTSLSLRYAAFLAAALEDRSMRVVWVDANLQQADGARYLGADERSSRTILDVAGGSLPDEREVLAALTPPSDTGRPVWALFGPALKADADPLVVTAGLYDHVVDVLRQRFDHIIVDTPVAEHHSQFFREFAIPQADQLVVVVPPLLPVVRAVREWLDLLGQPVAAGGMAIPDATVRVVLNMASTRSGCPEEAVRDAWLCRWTWAGAIPFDPAWTEATNNGRLIDGGSQLASGFADLVRATTGDVVRGSIAAGRSGGLLWRVVAGLRR